MLQKLISTRRLHLIAFLMSALLLTGMIIPVTSSPLSPTDTSPYITRISVSTEGSQGDDYSDFPAISADGRYIAFESFASNLVANDTNGDSGTGWDVFVHDRQTRQTSIVSVNSSGVQGNNGSFAPSISADGRFVAFISSASNLIADHNGKTHIYVHDLQTGQTAPVSINSQGELGNYHSGPMDVPPAISADGRFVAFTSEASNLVSDDQNGQDIFVHDRHTGQTTLVSVNSQGMQGTGGSSWNPVISADGRFVSFTSTTNNLVSNDNNGMSDIFVHDRQMGQTTLLSVNSEGFQANDKSYSPSISSNGRFITFESFASNLAPNDNYKTMDVFTHDLETEHTTIISLDDEGRPGGGAIQPEISGDGRYVVFSTYYNGVFFHDRQTKQKTRISVNNEGFSANDGSYQLAISANGRFVAMTSDASNLVLNDTNSKSDIFVVDTHQIPVTPPPVTPTPMTPTPDIPTSSLVLKDIQLSHFHLQQNNWQPLTALDPAKLPSLPSEYEGQVASFDGNIVRVGVSLQNTGNTASTVEVSIREKTSNTILLGSTPLTVPANATLNNVNILNWDTVGYAWKNNETLNSRRSLRLVIQQNGKIVATATREVWISPRPVILVHGWQSTEQSWKDDNYISYFPAEQTDWLVFAVDTLSTGKFREFKDAAYNGEQLHLYIDQIRKEHNAHHVDLIGHSYGGLISRWYIDKFMANTEVLRPPLDIKPIAISLIMLGTPNAGSPCARSILDLLMPGAHYFTEKNMEKFNEDIQNKNGVYFYNLAGGEITCAVYKNTDGIVPLSSALYTANHSAVYPSAHHWRCEERLCLRNKIGFTKYVLPWLALSPSEYKDRQLLEQFQAVERYTSQDSVIMTDYASVNVPGGASIDLAITLDGTSNAAYQTSPRPGVTTTLINPSGQVLGELTEEDTIFPNFSILMPNAGIWKIRVANATTQSVSVPYVILQDNIGVSIALSFGTPNAVTQVPIVLNVVTNNPSPSITSISATILDINGTSLAEVPLVFDGTNYTGLAPILPAGLYSAFAHATINGKTLHQIDQFFIEGVTSTPLIINGGFEDSLASWTLKGSGTKGDKVKCNKDTNSDGIADKIFANTGNCAFRFKGGVGEKSSLEQVVALTGQSLSINDVLTFSASINGRVTTSGKIKVRVKYNDATPTGKVNIPLGPTNSYSIVTGSVEIKSLDIKKIKVQFQHTGSSGKSYIDDVSLNVGVPQSFDIDPLPLPSTSNEGDFSTTDSILTLP